MAKSVKPRAHRASHSTHNQHEPNLFESLGKPITIKPYHHKPFRIRHLGFLLLTIVLLFAVVLQVGVMIGQRNNSSSVLPITETSQNQESQVSAVRSAYGFAFAYDDNQFDVEASAIDEQGNSVALERQELRENKQIHTLTLKPVADRVQSFDVATRMFVQVNPDKNAVDSIRSGAQGSTLSDGAIAGQIFPVNRAAEFDITTVSVVEEVLAGIHVQKTVYQNIPRFDGGSSYTVQWTGVVDGRAFSMRIEGIVGSSGTPDLYQSILDTLALRSAQKVAGVSTILGATVSAEPTSALDPKYRADLVSPSVVKIYHVFCATLVLNGNVAGPERCSANTGSGALVSSDGYIATNGHVVVQTPKDTFVDTMLANPQLFASFLRGTGMSNAQISQVLSRADLLAAVISKIYDLPDNLVQHKDEKKLLVAALGDEPLKLESLAQVKETFDMKDTDELKRAELIDFDFNKKDLYSIVAQDGKFESSDVALLKINVSNAPALNILKGGATQNQGILLLGYPGDAENSLVSQDSLAVTVTNGNISSIREAAGGSGKLYQSDADASGGNSGGPAVDENGSIIGLVTYRYKNGSETDAAKSYIRDIEDFVKLASDNGVTFTQESKTQDSWLKGLQLVSTSRYSKALKEFESIKDAYPAHRLVDNYIASSKQAISDGKDVKDFPVLLLVIGLGVGLAGLGAAVFIISRHHGKHQAYKLAGKPGGLAGPASVVGQPVYATASGQPQPQYGPQQQTYAQPVGVYNQQVAQQQTAPQQYQQPAASLPQQPVQSNQPSSQTGTVIVPQQPAQNPQDPQQLVQ